MMETTLYNVASALIEGLNTENRLLTVQELNNSGYSITLSYYVDVLLSMAYANIIFATNYDLMDLLKKMQNAVGFGESVTTLLPLLYYVRLNLNRWS